jgi:ribosomal protein L19E
VRLLWEWVVEKQEDITVVATKEKVERKVENNVIEEQDENRKSNQNQIKSKSEFYIINESHIII